MEGELRFTIAQDWTAGIGYKHVFLNKSFTPANSLAAFGPFTREFENLGEGIGAT